MSSLLGDDGAKSIVEEAKRIVDRMEQIAQQGPVGALSVMIFRRITSTLQSAQQSGLFSDRDINQATAWVLELMHLSDDLTVKIVDVAKEKMANDEGR